MSKNKLTRKRVGSDRLVGSPQQWLADAVVADPERGRVARRILSILPPDEIEAWRNGRGLTPETLAAIAALAAGDGMIGIDIVTVPEDRLRVLRVQSLLRKAGMLP